jgi:hypothetical protein
MTLLLAVMPDDGGALPRYTARYGQKCLLCHVDPSGGGMRSSYASQYLVPTEMSLRAFTMEELETIDPAIGEAVSLGADLRTLYLYSPEASRKDGNNFFQMQGDVYLRIQAGERLSLHLDQGISETTELFGLAFVLPAGGYVKAGRFTPAYGWRFADHEQFVRKYTGLAPPGRTDVGFELGFFPGGDLSLSFGLLNGAAGQRLDGDNRPAFVGRAELRRSFGDTNLSIGASAYRDEEAAAGAEHLLAGPFAYLSHGRLTWLGEWDWDRREDGEGGQLTALAASQELVWQLRQGLDLRATWNLFDPDVKLKTGSHVKLGLGLDLLATPFVGLLAMLSHNRFESGDAFSEEDFLRAEIMLHFLY